MTGAFPEMTRFSIQVGQGPNSGIWVEGVGAAQGDQVEVTGPVVDDSGRLMIWATAMTVIATDAALPEPEVLTTFEAANDDWEGVLIEVTATCTQPELGYGEWGIDDGTGMLRVDDLGYVYDSPIEGLEYRVRGPLDYSFDDFKIALRGVGDVVWSTPAAWLPVMNLQSHIATETVSSLMSQQVLAPMVFVITPPSLQIVEAGVCGHRDWCVMRSRSM